MNSAKRERAQSELLTCCVWKSTIPILKNMSFCSCIFDCKTEHLSPKSTENMGVWPKGGKQESLHALLHDAGIPSSLDSVLSVSQLACTFEDAVCVKWLSY